MFLLIIRLIEQFFWKLNKSRDEDDCKLIYRGFYKIHVILEKINNYDGSFRMLCHNFHDCLNTITFAFIHLLNNLYITEEINYLNETNFLLHFTKL